jgi:Xaa-Pro aminopeptidase
MNKEFYVENRHKMAARMSDGDVMLFFSGKVVRKTADENYPYFTSRNFLFLIGVKQEQSALIMEKRDGVLSESLFVLKPDQAREIWTGRRFTFDEINEFSGIERIDDICNLQKYLDKLISSRSAITLWLCFDALAPEDTVSMEQEFAKTIRKKHPHVTIQNSYPLVCSLRKIKTSQEIEAIRKGMKITEAGIRRMMQIAKPGMMEYELEAEFNHELALHGQRHSAFPSIIASGERIFYLHYSQLYGRVEEGDLILSDVGAGYDEYCTDISRVFPSTGHFNKNQAALYNIAYEANRAVMDQVRPGVPFSMTNQVCKEVSFKGLKALGLLEDFSQISRYVWHGVTHHVGLDTHDVGGYDDPMAENMVFTVDAGIYVREWGIGLRIEDNVLVTENGCENLSTSIPTTIEEIESLMA